jgi:hypothetical protein
MRQFHHLGLKSGISDVLGHRGTIQVVSVA